MLSVIGTDSMRIWWFSKASWPSFLQEIGEGRDLAQFLRSCFSLLSLTSQIKEGFPVTFLLQELETMRSKPSWWIQRGLNLKGMGPRFSSTESSRRIGLWSEIQLGRILDKAWSPRLRKEEWTRNLSRRAAMCPGPILLLVQVKLPLEGLMSTRSHPKMVSSTHSWEGSRTMDPPFFSFAARVTFRSPAMIMFSGLWRLKNETIES